MEYYHFLDTGTVIYYITGKMSNSCGGKGREDLPNRLLQKDAGIRKEARTSPQATQKLKNEPQNARLPCEVLCGAKLAVLLIGTGGSLPNLLGGIAGRSNDE